MNEDKPRIGVYVCMCGSNIAGTVDVPAVVEAASKLDDVVISRHNKYTCSSPGQSGIQEDIQQHKLNRVVVAACSPRMHERTWRALMTEVGLNPYLLEVANLREHVSWVHPAGDVSTQKAIDLVTAAVRRVSWHAPLFSQRMPVTKAALVVGGGIAGIEAAHTAGLNPIKLNCVVGDFSNESDVQSVKDFGFANDMQVRLIRLMHFETGCFSVVEGGTGGDCQQCNRLRLSSDGKIRPCLFSDISFSIRRLGPKQAIQQAVAEKPEAGGPCLHNWMHGIGG